MQIFLLSPFYAAELGVSPIHSTWCSRRFTPIRSVVTDKHQYQVITTPLLHGWPRMGSVNFILNAAFFPAFNGCSRASFPLGHRRPGAAKGGEMWTASGRSRFITNWLTTEAFQCPMVMSRDEGATELRYDVRRCGVLSLSLFFTIFFLRGGEEWDFA